MIQISIAVAATWQRNKAVSLVFSWLYAWVGYLYAISLGRAKTMH